jgi:L-asparaginase II
VFEPIYELTRGGRIESVHYGALAVVDAAGQLVASYGAPQTAAFMRSSGKPFQALPMVEAGTVEAFGFTTEELALACASHTGSDYHAEVARRIQRKAHVAEADLLCGAHVVDDQPTHKRLLCAGQNPTASHNNCSGKHSAMLAFARRRGWPLEDYVNPQHPVQQAVLRVVEDLCEMRASEITLGIDGCSAPNFALPLRNAALGLARLADPSQLPAARAAALRAIFNAMTTHPEMVQGEGRFDTELMRLKLGQLVSKGGAEGYAALALRPNARGAHAPALGIAIKIADGQARAANGVALEVLRQLGVLDPLELEQLARLGFAPTQTLRNHRGVVVGESRPCFRLRFAA